MGRFQGQPTVELFRARPVRIHNPAMNPLHSIYLERQKRLGSLHSALYPAWMPEPHAYSEVTRFVAAKRNPLQNIGVRVSKSPREPIELHAVHLPNRGGTIVVCRMECLEPQSYVTERDIARLFNKVGIVLEAPGTQIGWPELEERHLNDTFLSHAVLLNPQH